MKVFTATNGILFTITEDGVLLWEGGYDPRRVTDALREYFQRERDTQLGRWRDPKNPDMVAYRTPEDDDESGRCILLLDENTGGNHWEWEHTASPGPARRYFAAHPEPKPWRAAQPDCDEIWVLTIHGCEQPVYVTEFGGEPAFQVPGGETMSLSHGAITAGHRIWPEGDPS